MAVRIALCAAMEMISARRRVRRSRARCSGVPSTKQPCREPNSLCGLALELGPDSIDITHLHRKVLRGRKEIFATPASCGLLNYRRRPAPRSQGCEVRASSVTLDTGMVNKFPSVTDTRCLFVRKRHQRKVLGQFPVTAGVSTLSYVSSSLLCFGCDGIRSAELVCLTQVWAANALSRSAWYFLFISSSESPASPPEGLNFQLHSEQPKP